MAINEMVPDLIWAPDFWSPRNLVPEEFVPNENAINDFHAGTKFFGAQTSRGPNFLGTTIVMGSNEVGDHFSYNLFYLQTHFFLKVSRVSMALLKLFMADPALEPWYK